MGIQNMNISIFIPDLSWKLLIFVEHPFGKETQTCSDISLLIMRDT